MVDKWATGWVIYWDYSMDKMLVARKESNWESKLVHYVAEQLATYEAFLMVSTVVVMMV